MRTLKADAVGLSCMIFGLMPRTPKRGDGSRVILETPLLTLDKAGRASTPTTRTPALKPSIPTLNSFPPPCLIDWRLAGFASLLEELFDIFFQFGADFFLHTVDEECAIQVIDFVLDTARK